MRNIDKEQVSGETPCPRCGDEADWRFPDNDKRMVEITCPDCGTFELTRADFEKAESDIVEPEL
jgi:predicted RNA-binding Zn-ribbon protein involved in translation (DUF1610 family)